MRKLQKRVKVFSNKSGMGTSLEVHNEQLCERAKYPRLPIMAKLDLTCGKLSPSITVVLEGLSRVNDIWESLATGAFTSGETKYLTSGVPRRLRSYRLNITANKNVIVSEAYIGVGTVED